MNSNALSAWASSLPAIVVTILFVAAGCTTDSKPSAASDPVSTYKVKLQEEVAAIKGRLSKLKIDDAFKFNVVKSDSLVSPYVGTCELITAHPITLEGDGKSNTGQARFRIDLAHGLQEGIWKLTNCKFTFLPPSPGDDPYIAEVARQVAGRTREYDSLDALSLAILAECPQ